MAQHYIYDVNDELQQRVSPLLVSGVRVGADERSVVELGTIKALPTPGGQVVAIIADAMPAIPVNVRIRPNLDYGDLTLIREGLMMYVSAKGESAKATHRMRRMLRRA